MTASMDLDLFAGPGGWDTGAQMIGLDDVVGIEWDAAACRTRAAAGHKTIRADIAAFATKPLAGRVRGLIGSPECTTFSGAGKRGGIAAMKALESLIADMLAGKNTRAYWRREMARALRDSGWPPPRMARSRYCKACKRPVHLTREQRALLIRKAVLSASLVAEPARFIAAARPEWITLEQVPPVLPLWQAYAGGLRAMGYHVWTGILNSADYGVPQTRERAILIASRVRRVTRPAPTHYDPRKGMQLFGTPWMSMAEALGWGASERPVPTVTAGGTSTGGAEPFGHRDRDALLREQAEGRWVLHREVGAGFHEGHRARELGEPALTITGGGSSAGSGNGAGLRWMLHTNRGQAEDGSRQIRDPRSAPAPAPALTGKSGGQWEVKPETPDTSWYLRNNNNNNNACTRPADEPAGTLFFGGRSNWAAWVRDRPATTVQGDPRVGRPGTKDWTSGENQFAVDSVRISVREAAILQSFPPDYPWQGTQTKQFEQVGNAFPPLAAAHVLAMATGISAERLAA